MSSAPGDVYRQLLHAQRARNAPGFARVRVFVALGYAALVVIGRFGLEHPEFIAATPVAAGYLVLSVALWLGVRRGGALLDRVWFAVPLLDVPGAFLGQLVAGHASDNPQRVAMFTVSLYAAVILVSMMSFRSSTVAFASAVALAAQLLLLRLLGGSFADTMVAIFALVACGGIATMVVRQIEGLLTFGAGKVVAEQVLHDEVRHQVAERSRSLGDSLAQAAGALGAVQLAPGSTFGARYTVVKLLGSGAMGAVYEVERTTDQKRLALKLLKGNITANHARRFAREAEIGARLKHPNLVEIVDVGLGDSGLPFLVMDLVEGGSLASRSARFGDVAWALPLLEQISFGLAALHEGGVVHRDLKPANVLVAGTDDALVPKIADFGISRLEGPSDVAATLPRGLTQTGALLGTPLYMPPEAALGGKEMGPAADVFAFGVMSYELLTGKLPFANPVLLEVMAGRPVPKPLPLAAAVPEAVREVLVRCLLEQPEQRPTIAAVHAELRAAGAAAATLR